MTTIKQLHRVSHKTWPLVNCFECPLPYTVLDIKDILLFYFVKKMLLKYKILWNQIYIIGLPYNNFYFAFAFKQLNNTMKEDILNYSPIVIFRGTLCMYQLIHQFIPPSLPDVLTSLFTLWSVSKLDNITNNYKSAHFLNHAFFSEYSHLFTQKLKTTFYFNFDFYKIFHE